MPPEFKPKIVKRQVRDGLRLIGYMAVAPKGAKKTIRPVVQDTHRDAVAAICCPMDWPKYRKQGYKIEKIYMTVTK